MILLLLGFVILTAISVYAKTKIAKRFMLGLNCFVIHTPDAYLKLTNELPKANLFFALQSSYSSTSLYGQPGTGSHVPKEIWIKDEDLEKACALISNYYRIERIEKVVQVLDHLK